MTDGPPAGATRQICQAELDNQYRRLALPSPDAARLRHMGDTRKPARSKSRSYIALADGS
jgi:hypothetical protein